TGGLSTMLPILRVLMGGEPVQTWAGRIAVEKRMGVRLSDGKEVLAVYGVDKHSTAAAAGLKAGDELRVGDPGELKSTVAALADPDLRIVDLKIARGNETLAKSVPLPDLPWHYSALYRSARLLPDHPVWAIA